MKNAAALLAATLFATGLGLDARPLLAQEQPPPDEPAPAISVEDDARARALFLEGDAHYSAGRYEKAIVLFDEAYALSKRPLLLFNIANAHERLGNYSEAAASLREYVNGPDATDISSVNERIERLERNAAEKLAREAAPKAEPKEAPAPMEARPSPIVAPRQPVSSEADGPSITPAIVVLGLGAVVLAGSATTGIIASQAGSDADEKCSAGGVCQEAAEDDLDRQRRFALISDISLVTGIAVVGVGTYLLIRASSKRGRRSESVAVSVGPAGLSVRGSF